MVEQKGKRLLIEDSKNYTQNYDSAETIENDDLQGKTDAELEEIANILLVDIPGVYTDLQLARKAREMESRIKSRNIISNYIESFTEIDDTFIESLLGDIKDAANRLNISDQDYEMIIMRSRKVSYEDIAIACEISISTCYEHLQEARQKILQWDRFGYWEDVLNMQKCLQSNWYPMFREMILWCASGRPNFPKDRGK